jgi:hypothetical protein
MKYPDYVSKFRPKGTIIKSVRGVYYVYKATSRRVEGKKYPVHVIDKLLGTIDEAGLHPLSHALVDTTRVRIREYGFTNYLLKYEDAFLAKIYKGTKSLQRSLYRSLIVYLSPNSYLQDDLSNHIRPLDFYVEKLNIGIPNQITALSKMIEMDLAKLEPLKYVCAVYMGDRLFEGELTETQKNLLEELGVTENELRTEKLRALQHVEFDS